ncbi:MAG: InlB B-repeat-containing protein, partial [Vicinamibacterales bacterium]
MTRATRILSVLPALLLGVFVMSTAHAWAQAGPVGTSVQQYAGGVRWPDVAYDSHNRVFLVVWGPGTIRGIFVSEDGNPIGSSFRISDSTPWAQTPRAVFNPDTGVFLVAWQSSDGIVGNANATVVRGRMVSYTSGVSALPTKAYSGNTYSTRWETGPALAYSTGSGNFMVVWNRYSASGAEVGARLVSAAGDPVGSEIVVTSTTDEYEREPTVGYLPGSNRFLVAWAASGSVADSVRGKLYDASTGALNGTPLLFTQSTFTYVPEAALNITTGQVLVTWMQNDPATALPGNGWRAFGRLVDGNGAFVSSTPTRLSSIAGAYDANSVAFNALTQSFFLVTHGVNTAGQDVGFEISGTGTPISTASVVTSVTADGLTGTFNPRINASSQSSRWLMATAASFSSLWAQVIGGDGVAPPPDGGGTINPRLTISPTPAGGTVTGGGLACGTGGSTCQLTFTQSTTVTLQATADAGFQFSGWGGACSGSSSSTTVQVGAIVYCSATFVPAWGGADSEPPGCPAAPTPVFQAQPGPIGASVNQYTGGTQNQDVAYNQCQQVYLTVWGLGGTIRGRFINENGQGVGDAFAISSGQWAQTPKVLYNPNIGNFLVVWHSSASDTRTEVRAKLVTYPAGVAGPGAVLSASTYSTRWITKPALGYSPNSGRYLVAWSRYAADGGAEINARFIDTQAAPVANEFAVTSSAGEYDREPTIGHMPSTNRALVAWAGSGSTSDFVRGKLYDVATGASFGTPITFAQTRFTYVPEATLNSDTGNVFVAWMQDDAATALPGNGWRPFGNGVNGNGQLVYSSAKRLSSTVGAYDANSIAYNSFSKTFFLVTHGANTLQNVGFEIGGDGTSLGTAAVVTSITWPNLSGSFNPRLAASTRQPRWLVSTAASFQSMWTQLIGGKDTGGVFGSFTLAINPRPTGGVVTGGGLNCGTGGTACSVTFASSTPITITATADTGYAFTGWGGACSGTSTTTTVAVDSAKTCTAAFALSGSAPTAYALAVSPAPLNGTVSGGGLTCGAGGAVCQVVVASGTSVTLTATSTSGYSFTSWGGSCSGTSATTTVLMSASRTCSATFSVGLPTGPPYTMTISPKPAGGTITGAGLNCGTGGNLCAVTMPAPMGLGMSATPDPGYKFGAWTGDCSGLTASLTVQLSGARTCSASFIPTGTTFQLNVSPAPAGGTVTGGGITCGVGGSTCQVTYGSATAVTLTAAPASGYTFTGWGGTCTGTNASTAIQVDGIRTCTASFAATPTYQLNVSPVPAGGTVTGGGITCGTGGSTCQATYGSSTSVTLAAAPASGYTFTGWGGSCSGTSTSTTIQVDGVKTCSATFTAGSVNGPPYTMTISPRPTGGTVTGAGLNCGTGGTLCSASMPAAMSYGMSATPDSGYTFGGWSGDCIGTNPSLTVYLAGPRTCGATFTPNGSTTYQLNVSPVPAGGTVTGGGITCGIGGSTCQATYGSSTSVTLTAAPASGYTFTGWGG